MTRGAYDETANKKHRQHPHLASVKVQPAQVPIAATIGLSYKRVLRACEAEANCQASAVVDEVPQTQACDFI
eukprot:CAMPEP_0115557244 /NCGR_PEP_ID=MMETSP0271-20121206/98808_1 /TAXON_ID=71861 /ORGANISM="Scrippsiella trochoidea, Strain CCMP3099" /LENGTH=71 /DNA_ID=CAMNT_0002991193 /DNA_START=1173 /DNA_END=1389 /DNA_ORIENTATION=+